VWGEKESAGVEIHGVQRQGKIGGQRRGETLRIVLYVLGEGGGGVGGGKDQSVGYGG